MELLDGGREGKIIKEGNKIIRPFNPWTLDVHDFLDFSIEHGFEQLPKPCRMTEYEDKQKSKSSKILQNEVLSYVDGTAYNYPLPDFMRCDSMLRSAAILLKKYHEVGALYVSHLTGKETWMLPIKTPIEVMCHGDYAPYNVTIVDQKAYGMIDFDTLHPGPRLWDVVYGIYRFVPFVNPNNPDYYDTLKEQIRKTKVFADAYGLLEEDRKQVPSLMAERLNTLVAFMRGQAIKGNEDFEKNIEEGHMKLYLDDINYILQNEDKIIEGIC